MERRLAIAGEREHIGALAGGCHLLKLPSEAVGNILPGGAAGTGAMVGVEAAFTVDAVERAYLAIVGLKVDTKGKTKAAAVNRAENGGWVNNHVFLLSIRKGNHFSHFIALIVVKGLLSQAFFTTFAQNLVYYNLKNGKKQKQDP